MKLSEILLEKQVQSSWITNLTYNRPRRILSMRLSNGKIFEVPSITRQQFEQWVKAPSKGQYFHKNIRDRYQVNRVK